MRIRETLILAAILAGISAPALALQAQAVEGHWYNPAGGNCTTPLFKSGEMSMTSGGETAVKVTLTHNAQVVEGLLVIEGARRGQVVNPMTNQAMFLVDTPRGKVRVIPMMLTYRESFPAETPLELCPGTRPRVP
jgi:hypothetical protein